MVAWNDSRAHNIQEHRTQIESQIKNKKFWFFQSKVFRGGELLISGRKFSVETESEY